MKSATSFINARKEKQVHAQNFRTRRTQYLRSGTNIRAVEIKDILDQYNVVLDVIAEAK